MTKPLKSATHLWTAPPLSFHDPTAYSTVDSSTGRLSAGSSPSRSPVTPATPLRPGDATPAAAFSAASASPASKGAQFTIIANVPYDTVRQDLVTEFRKFGRVELAMVVCDEASRHPHKEWTSTAGYAFVRFSKRGEAAAAIQAATMGLITIRGTRVRADWARKDSYAKRGRVSAAQGAPSLGPYGIPDGITMLHDTLSANMQHNLDWEGAAALPAPLRLPDVGDAGDEHSPETETAVADVAQAARLLDTDACLVAAAGSAEAASMVADSSSMLESLAQALNIHASDVATLSCGGDRPNYAELTPHQMDSPLSAMKAAEKLCTQLVDLLSEESSSASSTSDTFCTAPFPAPLSTCQMADLLSPTSRGLLSFALSDVVSPNTFPHDVSPICKASTRRQAASQFGCSPEDLLKLAVSKFPNVAVAPCGGFDDSAHTKTGSSSHRSSTGDEAESGPTSSSDEGSAPSFAKSH
eukprot:Gregarina_sp_Pseudo_9__5759@NODE_84_length_4448_cov_24_851667_g76_i0_p1_GENE_NODE_84_length_4448_cov_24_851667_g76_i0NODE_84_length_4448_cov_24_851667_g76_i0_p1_ORF_typecomplete_len469_score116_32RRM_1/PF00076_22/3_1e09RRM_7/PF16367_5/2_3e05_NODE_84_length_4448_cov_24_851667_g76_i03291735